MMEYDVHEGPRWWRRRIRSRGPFVALIIPSILGIMAFAALQLSDSTLSGPFGLIGAYLAAPGLLVVGAPFSDRELYPIAVLGSAGLWLIVGFVAARKATRNPMATWGDYWRHYLWLLGGVWCGVAGALLIATLRLGDGIVDWL
jgi:hypothetical protein